MNLKSLFALAAIAAATAGAHAALPDEYVLNHNVQAPVQTAAPRIVERVAQVDEYHRHQFPARDAAQVLQRVQVSAEAREARHLGLIAEGEAGAPVASAAQAEQVRQAGLRAVQQHLAGR